MVIKILFILNILYSFEVSENIQKDLIKEKLRIKNIMLKSRNISYFNIKNNNKFLMKNKNNSYKKNEFLSGVISLGLKSKLNKKNYVKWLNKRYMRIEFSKYKNQKKLVNGKLSFKNIVSENLNKKSNLVKSISNLLFMHSVDSIKYNNEEIFQNKKLPFIFDAGIPLILLSKELINQIKNKIENSQTNCFYENSILLCEVNNKDTFKDFKDITINLNKINYILKPEDYILEKQIKEGKEIYFLKFGITNMKFGILGLPFFKNLISYYDYDNREILFYKKVNNFKSMLGDKIIPSYENERRKKIIFYSVYTVLSFGIIITIVLLSVYSK